MGTSSDTAKVLLELASRHERDLVQRLDKLEKLKRECEEIRAKMEALRLAAQEIEIAENGPSSGQAERAKHSAAEFRVVFRRLLEGSDGGMHHKEIYEVLRSERPNLDEAGTRILVYNVAKKYADEFEIKRGRLYLKQVTAGSNASLSPERVEGGSTSPVQVASTAKPVADEPWMKRRSLVTQRRVDGADAPQSSNTEKGGNAEEDDLPF